MVPDAGVSCGREVGRGRRLNTIAITTFEAAGQTLRTFVEDGAIWIIGADIITGLTLSNAARVYARLSADGKRYVTRSAVGYVKAGKPMVAVSESGFYKLVLRSDKPKALAFQEWVTREVLPAIRRTGGYRLQGVAPEAAEEGRIGQASDLPKQTASQARLPRTLANRTPLRARPWRGDLSSLTYFPRGTTLFESLPSRFVEAETTGSHKSLSVCDKSV